MHPCQAGPHLPCSVLADPGAFVVNVNIVVVANALLGEATNMQEFGAVFGIKMMPSHFLGGNSLISHTMLMSWGGRENNSSRSPSVTKEENSTFICCGRSEQAGGGGYSQTWLCTSSAVLPSITAQALSSPASIHFAASLLLVQMQLGDAE